MNLLSQRLYTVFHNEINYCGEIYSSYIQKKAKEFVNSNIYKQSSSMSSIQERISDMETKIHRMEKQKNTTNLQLRSLIMKEAKAKEIKKNHISKLRHSIQKAKKITPNQLQNAIKKMVELVTKISNTGR